LRIYAVVDDSLARHLLGDSVDVFVRREDAERFIDEILRRRFRARELPADRGAGVCRLLLPIPAELVDEQLAVDFDRRGTE
jgi:hypothetical protein